MPSRGWALHKNQSTPEHGLAHRRLGDAWCCWGLFLFLLFLSFFSSSSAAPPLWHWAARRQSSPCVVHAGHLLDYRKASPHMHMFTAIGSNHHVSTFRACHLPLGFRRGSFRFVGFRGFCLGFACFRGFVPFSSRFVPLRFASLRSAAFVLLLSLRLLWLSRAFALLASRPSRFAPLRSALLRVAALASASLALLRFFRLVVSSRSRLEALQVQHLVGLDLFGVGWWVIPKMF